MRSHVISTRFLLLLLFALLLSACGGGSNTGSSTPAPTATPTQALDAYGTPITFPSTAPQRIVSLVPSTSEILGALHLDARVVGVDYYTDYPADLTKLTKVSDVNGKYNVEQIVQLKPDLVLSYGQDTKQYDSQLTSLGLHVVDLPSTNLTGILHEILVVGRLTFTQSTANVVVNQLQQQINQVKSAVAGSTAPKVMIELDDSTPGKPYVFGGSSFGDELLQDANGIDVFHDNSSNGGFPQVTDEAIISANPQYIFLTEDPQYGGNVNAVYKRPNWGSIAALQMHHVYHLNASLIGRPGPRLVEGLRCIAQVIHPDKFSGPLPTYCTA
ncbi:MAG TPA: ABC transporter substrate-binding protein [Ktedonobacteraceae bacterium]|jgi:iron complex transport system substrate-binding protein|nr:ABC transporter substrate-binding protein [Ktedonobacteraceae bacterium]